MKNDLTELVFVLDRSGSMGGLEEDTIGGFNSMIEKQKQGTGKVIVSTVLFDHIAEVIHDRVDIEQVSPMTSKEYFARGMTALLDAVGDAIHHIGNVHKYAREEDVPAKTIFVITTDGEENSSKRYSVEKVKSMITRQQEKYGWEFLFLGANIDVVETASNLGIRRDRMADVAASSAGVKESFDLMSCALESIDSGAEFSLADYKTKKKKDDE